MKYIEIEMSKKFRDYVIENCTGKITAHKIITELLKNKGISKPKDLRVSWCGIGDLKYQGRNIKECGIIPVSGIIKIGV